MELTTSLTAISGVGPALAAKFKTIGINNVAELLDYFPRTHNDYSKVSLIKSLRPGMVTIAATIKQAKGRYVRRGLHITEAVASDNSGSVRLIWFNQPYRARALKTHQFYYVTGKLELKRQHFSILNPSAELASDFPLHTARIVPIYRESKGITSSLVRRVIGSLLKSTAQLPNPLPLEIIKRYGLMTYPQAVKELHFPSSSEALEKAKYSLGFIEIFELMLASALIKAEVEHELAPRITFKTNLAQNFVKSLPFKLTNAQRKALWQIFKDIEKSKPMNRLLEGDVGSGKTVVAAMAGLMALSQDYQVAFLAPTEILARQHAETLADLLKTYQAESLSILIGSLKTLWSAHKLCCNKSCLLKILDF
jgi:ATP-dependent DNA helicase RecG